MPGPDETTMIIIVDDFDSPSHRIGGNGEREVTEIPHRFRSTKLSGFPRFKLHD